MFILQRVQTSCRRVAAIAAQTAFTTSRLGRVLHRRARNWAPQQTASAIYQSDKSQWVIGSRRLNHRRRRFTRANRTEIRSVAQQQQQQRRTSLTIIIVIIASQRLIQPPQTDSDLSCLWRSKIYVITIIFSSACVFFSFI